MASVDLRPVTSAGKTCICISGFGYLSHHTVRARRIARAVEAAHPSRFETFFWFDQQRYRGEKPKKTGLPRSAYPLEGSFLHSFYASLDETERQRLANHITSPFIWLAHPDGRCECLGGRSELCEWVEKHLGLDPKASAALALAKAPPPKFLQEPSVLRQAFMIVFQNRGQGVTGSAAHA